MTRRRPIAWFLILALASCLCGILMNHREPAAPDGTPIPSRSEVTRPQVPAKVPGDLLLEGYGDPASPPIEDLRKLQHVVGGYFSLIKNATRNPIGGNEDLSAALRGENPNREVFVRPESRVFSKDGMLIDRWDVPVIVHPQAWRQLELRSAGPDRTPYTADDLVLQPDGSSGEANR